MVMRDIPKDRRLAGFPWVVVSGIHAEVLEVRAERQTWEEFEARLLEKYGLDDALRLSKWDFMEWVETPDASFGARPDRTIHKSCPTIRQIGGRNGPGASGPPARD